MDPAFYSHLTGFDWDEGNRDKNWARHKFSNTECEEVFFHRPLVVAADETHSAAEARYFALGKTRAGRNLFVVFTTRGEKIRVISARDMKRKERRRYREAEEAGS